MKSSPACSGARLRSSFAAFACQDDGGATIWNVTWLLVFAGMAGLSIDSSNGYRNLAISQSTSDAASLAGVIELPNPYRELPFNPAETAYDATVKAKAVEFAEKNMTPGIYGDVLTYDEIFIGNWYNKNGERRFTPGQSFQQLVDDGLYASTDQVPVNAVRVFLFQEEADRGNGVPTSLMHMVGMDHWSVVTTATAQIGGYECWNEGLMSRKKICQTTNSDWYAGFCMYGKEGITLRPNNDWGEGSHAYMPSTAHDGIDPSNTDPDIQEYPLTTYMNADSWHVPLVNKVPTIATSLLTGDNYYAHTGFAAGAPVYRLTATTVSMDFTANDDVGWVVGNLQTGGTGGGGGGGSSGGAGGCQGGSSGGSDLTEEERSLDEWDPGVNVSGLPVWTGPLQPGNIYYYTGNKDISISGDLNDVVIVSHGGFSLGKDTAIESTTLVSLDNNTGGNDSVRLSNGTRLGRIDACEEGGDAMVYTMGSIGGPSDTSFFGATMVAGGSIGFAAGVDSMYGIAAFAAGNLKFTANNTAGGIGGNGILDPDGCAEGVKVPIPDNDLRLSLVD